MSRHGHRGSGHRFHHADIALLGGFIALVVALTGNDSETQFRVWGSTDVGRYCRGLWCAWSSAGCCCGAGSQLCGVRPTRFSPSLPRTMRLQFFPNRRFSRGWLAAQTPRLRRPDFPVRRFLAY
jgi:hypothetical protein